MPISLVLSEKSPIHHQSVLSVRINLYKAKTVIHHLIPQYAVSDLCFSFIIGGAGVLLHIVGEEYFSGWFTKPWIDCFYIAGCCALWVKSAPFPGLLDIEMLSKDHIFYLAA